jgi:hypothetical protein
MGVYPTFFSNAFAATTAKIVAEYHTETGKAAP